VARGRQRGLLPLDFARNRPSSFFFFFFSATPAAECMRVALRGSRTKWKSFSPVSFDGHCQAVAILSVFSLVRSAGMRRRRFLRRMMRGAPSLSPTNLDLIKRWFVPWTGANTRPRMPGCLRCRGWSRLSSHKSSAVFPPRWAEGVRQAGGRYRWPVALFPVIRFSFVESERRAEDGFNSRITSEAPGARACGL